MLGLKTVNLKLEFTSTINEMYAHVVIPTCVYAGDCVAWLHVGSDYEGRSRFSYLSKQRTTVAVLTHRIWSKIAGLQETGTAEGTRTGSD